MNIVSPPTANCVSHKTETRRCEIPPAAGRPLNNHEVVGRIKERSDAAPATERVEGGFYWRCRNGAALGPAYFSQRCEIPPAAGRAR
ncbi:MAG: hypothetical protein CMJ72_14950 [Planctomycetaceae bacterium]|nr:hypothetical protein [Planctomycetaceae bacterium]